MELPVMMILKGKLQARPYNVQTVFVAASFQLAILSFWVSLLLEAGRRIRRKSESRLSD